jgi:uncharacterized protein (TIGR02266 family)
MSQERRKHPRVSVAVEVDVTSDHNFYVGRTRDISVGGLFIEADVGIEIGATISLDLALDGRKFALQGEVMWALAGEDGSTAGIGVRFVKLPDAARRAIEKFMGKRAPHGIDTEPVGGPPPLPKREDG